MSKQAWTKERVTSLIKTAHSYLVDDSITRCRLAFRHMSPEQMQEMHGASGRTREEVLNGYEESEKKGEEAYDLIESAANALLDIPDPEAFMAAHDKLVEACEAIEDSATHSEFEIASDRMAEALAAVKEASDVKADKPKWQSPIRECDTYWKKMKGYIHLMTHPAEGFTDWKETPPRGCDTKSVPYRMGDRLNLSLMSQDPLWQFYHTVFWSEDPDACPPT